MNETVTAQELAIALDTTPRAIRVMLDRISTKSTIKEGNGGKIKHYILTDLPEKYRLALAVHRATGNVPKQGSEAYQIGAEAAKAILAERAREKELERIAKEQNLDAYHRLSGEKQHEAAARLEFLNLCDGFLAAGGYATSKNGGRNKRGVRAFAEAYNAGTLEIPGHVIEAAGERTSYSTIVRLFDRYRQGGLAALAKGHHNPRRGHTALNAEQQDVVISTMCKNPSTSNANIRKMLQGQFGRMVPSEFAIARFRKRWIEEHRELWQFYTNPDQWKNECMLSFGSASARVERLNQLWEADSTPADVMLADGRYSIIGTIDVYSRRLRLFVSKTSKAVSVVALLRHCIIDWGVPEILRIDNGQDYRSAHVTRVLEGLEIAREYCTPFQGQEKPHIERAFRTFLHGMVELMPEYIGHNVAERKAIEARRSFAERIMKKGGDPVEVNMTAADLQKFCNEWTEFVYQHDAHSGLNGQKPIDMARNWKQPIRRIHDMRALDMLLMPAPTDGGRRQIGKKGVQVNGRFYQAKEFAGNMGKSVFVLLDPADMGTAFIYLYGPQGDRSFLAVAIDPAWHGIDRAKFTASSRNHQTRIMREGAKQLRQLSKAEGQREAYADYMQFRKDEVANLVEFPKQSEEHTTPMLHEAAKAAVAAEKAVAHQDEMQHKLQEIEILLSAPEPPKPAAEKKVLNLITCKSDRYLDILNSVRRERRKLSRWEYDFLTDFYTTEQSGKAYLLLEGDLREKAGVEESGQAEM